MARAWRVQVCSLIVAASLLLASCTTTKVIYTKDNETETLDITSKGTHKISFSKEGLQIESK